MSPLYVRFHNFISDLREGGIPISSSQSEDCFRALAAVDWNREAIFYSALLSTLLKESSLRPVFDEIYARHFSSFFAGNKSTARHLESLREALIEMRADQPGEGEGKTGTGDGERGKPSPRRQRPTRRGGSDPVDPLTKDFGSLTPADIKRMETLIPLLGKRLASKKIIKRRREDNGSIDHRRTLRQSMATGGVPVDVFIKKKLRQKPVIFVLCDVSMSCLFYSAFSLALVSTLEKFFRQVRSFAFIGETEEITSLLRTENGPNLRTHVLYATSVTGESGRTDYGQSLSTFLERYGQDLSHQSYVLIFGDARTNWFSPRPQILKTIQSRVKRVYWFNPEPESEWNSGDSSMKRYQPYCNKMFSCPNLDALSRAISEL